MQLTQLTSSVSAQNPSVFKFGQNEIRVFERNKEPWFVATDIAKCLGIKNPKDAVKNLRQIERWGFNPQRGGSLTLVSESGLYTMILRSDSAIKEYAAALNESRNAGSLSVSSAGTLNTKNSGVSVKKNTFFGG